MLKPADLFVDDDSVKRKDAYNSLMNGIYANEALENIVRLYTDYVLACKNGNKVHAAKALKIDRRTIQRWEKEAKIAQENLLERARAIVAEIVAEEGNV